MPKSTAPKPSKAARKGGQKHAKKAKKNELLNGKPKQRKVKRRIKTMPAGNHNHHSAEKVDEGGSAARIAERCRQGFLGDEEEEEESADEEEGDESNDEEEGDEDEEEAEETK
jgi:hypothetical protein